MRDLALVFVGSGLGGVLRHGVGMAAARAGIVSTWSTVAINVLGTFVAVLLAQWLAVHAERSAAAHVEHARAAAVSAFLAVGVLGGFTTYSAFQVHVFAAIARGAWGTAALVLVVTVVGCLAAGALAFAIARSW